MEEDEEGQVLHDPHQRISGQGVGGGDNAMVRDHEPSLSSSPPPPSSSLNRVGQLVWVTETGETVHYTILLVQKDLATLRPQSGHENCHAYLSDCHPVSTTGSPSGISAASSSSSNSGGGGELGSGEGQGGGKLIIEPG